MEFFTISLLNGISYGLLLFMLSSGLTLIFSMMGVLNFAHASFYMLGAYFAFSHRPPSLSAYWPALWYVAPLLVGCARCRLSRSTVCGVYTSSGTVPELLITFGLSFIILETGAACLGHAAPSTTVCRPRWTVRCSRCLEPSSRCTAAS
jgi:branched-chain amino acid transport system permease protein